MISINKNFFYCIVGWLIVFAVCYFAAVAFNDWEDRTDYELFGQSNGVEYSLGVYDTEQDVHTAEALISQDYDSTYYYEVTV